jgi:Phage integrase, N-terminal SAM-like domain
MHMTLNVPALTCTATSLPVTLRAALDSAADLARAEKSAATQRAYKSDFAIFSAWCAGQGLCSLPADPAAVAAFIAAETARGIKSSTIARRVAGIRYSHKLAGYSSPTDYERVKAVVRGARHKFGAAGSQRETKQHQGTVTLAGKVATVRGDHGKHFIGSRRGLLCWRCAERPPA